MPWKFVFDKGYKPCILTLIILKSMLTPTQIVRFLPEFVFAHKSCYIYMYVCIHNYKNFPRAHNHRTYCILGMHNNITFDSNEIHVKEQKKIMKEKKIDYQLFVQKQSYPNDLK